jgi:vancomycin resistance protein YoaR
VTAIADAVRTGSHTVTLAFTRPAARLPTGAARQVTSLLGTFTPRYTCCQPRVTNIRQIAAAVDGTVVLPGERFSLNEAGGERTRAGGYVPAPFIADGKVVDSVGGGVSQFSTTLYNAAYLAGLRIDAHRPHSFYIDRYPPGREATLNFPDIDMAWANDTAAPVLIRTATDETSVVASIYGIDHGRRVRAQTGERRPVSGGAFQITVTRVLRYRDGTSKRQPFTTRYDRPPPPEQ